MIQTKNITKMYQNGFQAVKGLNLNVAQGDIFGFLGPNGAGKTTTIRMLDGLLKPTSGEIQIAGMDVQKEPVRIKRMIGVVPESHGYYDWMSAQEYLEYFAVLFEMKKGMADYILELLNRVGLEEKRNIPIGQFSRGMKQRLGIAKALINRPQIIFLDEPTLGLDPRGQKEIQELLLEINRRDGITIFITSHLLKDIEVLCNKVCIIKDGTLVEQGGIKELQEKYMSCYTMYVQTNDNVGAMSFIESFSSVKEARILENGKLEVKLKKGLEKGKINQLKHRILEGLELSNIDLEELSKKTVSMEDIFFYATEAEKGGTGSHE